MVQIHVTALQGCLPALRRFAFSLTKDDDRANDLVQDCVERCWQKQHLFDGENLQSWMFTVCRRVFLNQIRTLSERSVHVDIDEMTTDRLGHAPSQDWSMHYKDMVGGLDRLSLGDQQLLSLAALEGLKYSELAKELDVPVGTIRSRLSRARMRLRAELEPALSVAVA